MDLEVIRESETRFRSYVDALSSVIGHADRKRPLEDYCVGLMGPSERKSVEPIAAVTAPGRTAAQHQSLLHFVGESNWSDEKVLAKVREMVLPAIERHGAIEAWIIDDTGFPKKGMHSVGVASQYCGQLGREGNCQVAVSLSVANHHASLPVASAVSAARMDQGPQTLPQSRRSSDSPLHDQATDCARAHQGCACSRRPPRGGADRRRLWS